MKQYLILGLVAMGLFGVSAALSVWLNRSHAATEEKSHADDKSHGDDKSHADDAAHKKGGGKDSESGDKDKEKDKSHGAPSRPLPKSSDHGHDGPGAADTSGLRGREERLERRQAQTEIILRDLQLEREALDDLMKKVTAEAKEAATRPPEPEPKAAAKKDAEVDAAAERKNIEQLAQIYGTMPPESAAPILKRMVDSGQLDTTVRIIAQMKDRQAAQILAAMSDPDIATQISTRIRQMRRPGTPGAGTVPPIAPLPGIPRDTSP